MERIRKYCPLWGEWKVKRKIGEGSFGAVYEVEKTIAGNVSSSAVKFISFDNSEMLRGITVDETMSAEKMEEIKLEAAKKNVREAALMDKLQGRANIVTIYDYGIYPNEKTTDVLIRMELLTNLNHYIDEVKTDTDFVIKLGLDLCRALENCEKEKIIHRDIKPDNIFINKDGDFKLGDFGLSRKMNKSASLSLRKSKGTPLYMPPEAFGWGQHVDHTSDLYSLGIVMYQLLNDGNIPFCMNKNDFEDEDNAIGRRLDGEEFDAPVHEKGKLWDIIQKACRFQKEERYQSASEMRKDLEALKKQRDGEKAVIHSEIQQTETVEVPKLIRTYRPHDVFTFGFYPQDNGISTVGTPIMWKVLKVEEGKMLVISTLVLDCRCYHKTKEKAYYEKEETVTWETSDMRKWLNETFYETAFNIEEQKRILTTSVEKKKNTDSNPEVEKDKMFLLNMDEVQQYFYLEDSRRCEASSYALGKGVEHSGGYQYYASWWLRSPGDNGPESVAYVSKYGHVSSRGAMVNDVGVRPAM